MAAEPDPARFVLEMAEHPGKPAKMITPDGQKLPKYGFEGGRVIRLGETYHLFISEMTGDPKWCKTMLAHWTSGDGQTFTRRSTLYESTGDYTGKDPRAALFLPIPIYNERENRWNLFYSAFKSAPSAGGRWLLNHEGRIWRAASKIPGADGIGGPYEDVGIVLQPGSDSDPWEGLQGTDSFFPFHVGNEWLAFYGSAHTQRWPTDFWGVGLARADSLAGPWKRISAINPVLKPRAENPHVVKVREGMYAAVLDAVYEQHPENKRIGYSFSIDGRNWMPPRYVTLDAGENNWINQIRTPISIIPQKDDRLLVYYTATDKPGVGLISKVILHLRETPAAPAGS
jgi:hypothetical protein